MELFQGYDTFTGALKNTVVTGTATLPQNAVQNAVCSVATSLEDLHQSLEIDASVSVSYAAYQADAKSKYLHTLDLTTYSVVVVVRACNRSTVERVNADVPDTIRSALKTVGDVSNFVRKNGDSFISSVTSGSEYFATFTFYSQSRAEQTAVEVALNGKGAIAGVSVDASFATKIGNALKQVNVRYRIDQYLEGIGNTSLPYDKDQDQMIIKMVDFAMNFSSMPVSAPTTVSFVATPYEELLPDVNFDQVTENRDAFKGNDVELGWGRMIAKLSSLRNDCLAIRKTYNWYGGFSDDLLDHNYQQVVKDLGVLLTLVDTVDQHPTTAPIFTPPASLSLGTPSLRCTVTAGAMRATVDNPSFADKTYVGGEGGENGYSDVTADKIGQHVRIRTLQVYKGAWVDRLIVTYVVPAGVPNVDPMELQLVHGGGQGQGSTILTLANDEFVRQVGGWTGCWPGFCVVSALNFVTSKDQTITTWSTPDANYKVWNAQPGEVLVGFIGRSGQDLDQLAPQVLRFQTASWSSEEMPRRRLATTSA